MWNLSCRKTRRVLALSAGNDLDERELAQAHRHLAACPHCREVWQGLKQSQQIFERISSAPAERLPSVWPGVARHVRTIDAQPAHADWRGWLPAGALAAASLAIVVISLPQGPAPQNENAPSVIFTQPVESAPQQVPFLPDHRDISRIPRGRAANPNANQPAPPATEDRSF